jgi:hypothetical protein
MGKRQFQCRWLSSRCRQGFLDGSQRAFRQAGASSAGARWQMLHLIEPAAWSANKIEVLDSEIGFLADR